MLERSQAPRSGAWKSQRVANQGLTSVDTEVRVEVTKIDQEVWNNGFS